MSPRTPEQFNEIREATKHKIMEVALELFANEGYYAPALEAYDKYLQLDDTNGNVLFEKAFILLTAIVDLEGGLTTLSASVSAGFKDENRFRELAEYPDLIYGIEIRDYLVKNGLYDDEEVPQEVISDESSGDSIE